MYMKAKSYWNPYLRISKSLLETNRIVFRMRPNYYK